MTSLRVACTHGYLEVIKVLIAAGASVSTADKVRAEGRVVVRLVRLVLSIEVKGRHNGLNLLVTCMELASWRLGALRGSQRACCVQCGHGDGRCTVRRPLCAGSAGGVLSARHAAGGACVRHGGSHLP